LVPIKISDRPDTPQIAVARDMADLLGTHLVVNEGVGSEMRFNGVNFHGEDTGKTIFVSADSRISALSIFGHEVGHDFQSQFPEHYGKAGPDGTYGGLLGVLQPMIGVARIAERQALYEKAGKPISHEQALSEIVKTCWATASARRRFETTSASVMSVFFKSWPPREGDPGARERMHSVLRW
jgi:hypothetical protein